MRHARSPGLNENGVTMISTSGTAGSFSIASCCSYCACNPGGIDPSARPRASLVSMLEMISVARAGEVSFWIGRKLSPVNASPSGSA